MIKTFEELKPMIPLEQFLPHQECSAREDTESTKKPFIQKKLSEAEKQYAEAAKQGNRDAQYYLGCAYRRGDGVEKDTSLAEKWLKEAVSQNDERALVELGRLYGSDRKEYEKAFECFRWASYMQNTTACFLLGACYENGWGTSVDYEKALENYERAGREGNAHAMHRAGWIHWHVYGDVISAESWLKRGVEHGNAEAGKCLEDLKKAVAEEMKRLRALRKSVKEESK